MRRIKLFLLLATAFCPGALRAGTITGKVIGPLGAPVAGAEIRIKGLNFPIPPKTSLLGTFSVTVPPGTYDVGIIPSQSTLLVPTLIKGVKVLLTASVGTVRVGKGFKLTGKVVTSPSNLPLFNADLNVYDQKTRVKLYTPDDNTDAFGVFSIIVPGGTYRVRVTPPVGRLLVAQEARNVLVNKLTVLNTFVIKPGVLVTGTVVDSLTKLPLSGVDLDADDAITGTRIVTPLDNTNSLGVFKLILPPGLYHLNFDPPRGRNHVGKRIYNVRITAAANLGVTALDRGFLLTGTVLGPGATPVAGANLDLLTSPGDTSLYLSNDSTDASGKFVVAVAAGTYRLSVEPPTGSTLAGAVSASFKVAANTAVPTFNLVKGVPITGTLTGWNGAPEVGANLDLVDPVTGTVIPTAGDLTDTLGKFTIQAPPGTWNLEIHTKKLSFSRSTTIKGLVMNGPKTIVKKLSLVPVGVYFDSVGIPTATRGGSVTASLVFVNMGPTTVNAKMSLAVKDPNGVWSYVIKPITLPLPGFYAVAAVNLPFPVPLVNTANLGKVFKYQFRVEDPLTGAEMDKDGFQLVIR